VRQLIIDRSTFIDNTARMGGVSFVKQNEVAIRDSTFARNRSGLLIDGTEVGGPFGGVWLVEGTLDLVNSTFVDNQPTALNVEAGSGAAVNATFVDSRPAGGLHVRNSLFVDTACGQSLDGDHNLQWPEGAPCAGGTAFADPQAGDLGDNGGPTPTVLPGSAVLGVGADCPEVDQRGEPRDTQSCAAGAVEPQRGKGK
jgi:hypothetical protein